MIDSFSESEQEKIINEIKQAGFPLEILTAITLSKKGWGVRPSLDYLDPILSDYRETDIVAYKNSNIPNLFNVLVIECKKSEANPWVFIQQKRMGNLSENLNIATLRQDYVYYDRLEETMNDHHYSTVPICTYSLVPFASKKDPNNRLAKSIYQAKNQVISATARIYDQFEQMHKKYRNSLRFTFIYPIIVFDGRLYSAQIQGDNVELFEENHLIFSIERELSNKRTIGIAPNSQRDQDYKPYFIDVVKKEHFEQFLDIFENYYKNIIESFPSCHYDIEQSS